MKQTFILVFILSLFFGIHQKVLAQNTFGYLGGRIISAPKSFEILAVEAMGFICVQPGTTFNIMPMGTGIAGPFIAYFGLLPRGGSEPTTGKSILGIYQNTTTPITCVHPLGAEITINVFPLIMYGTSKI